MTKIVAFGRSRVMLADGPASDHQARISEDLTPKSRHNSNI